MSGIDFHAAVGERHPEMLPRIAFLTGGAFTPQAESFLERIPNRWLPKPLDDKTLTNLVATMVS
jgi:hypothetical protein